MTTPGEYEVIVSDALTEKLQIEIINLKLVFGSFMGKKKSGKA